MNNTSFLPSPRVVYKFVFRSGCRENWGMLKMTANLGWSKFLPGGGTAIGRYNQNSRGQALYSALTIGVKHWLNDGSSKFWPIFKHGYVINDAINHIFYRHDYTAMAHLHANFDDHTINRFRVIANNVPISFKQEYRNRICRHSVTSSVPSSALKISFNA